MISTSVNFAWDAVFGRFHINIMVRCYHTYSNLSKEVVGQGEVLVA